jgi:diguanylate cyclase (GGDEF)-like protein
MRSPRSFLPPLRSLQSRIIVVFAVLIVAIQAAVVLLLDAALSRTAEVRLREDLVVGERVFRRVLEQNNRQLMQSAEVLSRDFGFREAVATRDVDTMRSALANHGARIGVDAMAVVSQQDQVLADALRPGTDGKPFRDAWLVSAARAEGRAFGLVVEDRQAYQMVIVPVLAPQPVAWAAFGNRIDERLVGELESLTALKVSFLARNAAGQWDVLASAGSATAQEILGDTASASPVLGQPMPVETARGALETVLLPIEQRGGSLVVAALQRSVDEALAPLRRIEALLLLIALGSLVIAAGGSAVIARGVVRPLAALADATRRVAEGQYEHGVDVSGPDEVAELARRFNAMREGIAAREEQIMHLAYRDVLTDLPNRALFYDRLGMALALARRTERPLAVLLMDLDRFKYVNDTLGHHVGDQVLQHAARRLTELVRRSDTIARLGGDEFALLLVSSDLEDAAQIAGKALAVLEEPIMIGGHTIDVRASVGIAGYPAHAEDGETLLRHADAAMYAAKKHSLGHAVYDPRRDREHAAEQLSLLSELRRALAADEFRIFYQPKVDLATGDIGGVECLLRWQHPERGLVPPARFIPFAEETGFIKSITEWLIRHAVRQCGEWRAAGRVLCMAVNISAQDLLNPALADIVAGALEEHGVPAELLAMEITESGFMQDPARAVELMHALSALGVRLSIDDFGTGYSSLAYLKRLPVHELKIDRSFVRQVAQDPKDRAIVLSTIELGHNLGLTVVAEGVEEQPACDMLRRLGCDLAQGFLFSPALAAGDLERWLAARPAVQLLPSPS